MPLLQQTLLPITLTVKPKGKAGACCALAQHNRKCRPRRDLAALIAAHLCTPAHQLCLRPIVSAQHAASPVPSGATRRPAARGCQRPGRRSSRGPGLNSSSGSGLRRQGGLAAAPSSPAPLLSRARGVCGEVGGAGAPAQARVCAGAATEATTRRRCLHVAAQGPLFSHAPAACAAGAWCAPSKGLCIHGVPWAVCSCARGPLSCMLSVMPGGAKPAHHRSLLYPQHQHHLQGREGRQREDGQGAAGQEHPGGARTFLPARQLHVLARAHLAAPSSWQLPASALALTDLDGRSHSSQPASLSWSPARRAPMLCPTPAPLLSNAPEQIAHENEVELEGACEGSLACSTCHVIVEDQVRLLSCIAGLLSTDCPAAWAGIVVWDGAVPGGSQHACTLHCCAV